MSAKLGIGQPGADAPLREHIGWYVRQGYQVASQTETTAIVYLPGSAAREEDTTVYLTVQGGRVKTFP